MWSEIHENLIWKCDRFFSDPILSKIDSFIENEIEHVTTKSHTTNTPLITSSVFHYNLVTKTPFAEIGVHEELIEQLNSLLIHLGDTISTDTPLRTSQAMLKYFSQESNYCLHTEDEDQFGGWVYVVYLTNETSGPIYFPTEKSVYSNIAGQELNDWKKMTQYLKNKESRFFYVPNDFTFLPQRNFALAFRVGLAHKVFPLKEKNIGRYCLTGWPFAKFK